MNLLERIIWDRLVGVLVWNETSRSTSFEYSKEFIKRFENEVIDD